MVEMQYIIGITTIYCYLILSPRKEQLVAIAMGIAPLIRSEASPRKEQLAWYYYELPRP